MRKATGRYRTYSIPGKTATLVPEFAVEDLPLSRTGALVPEFAVKDLPLGRTVMMIMMRMIGVETTVVIIFINILQYAVVYIC